MNVRAMFDSAAQSIPPAFLIEAYSQGIFPMVLEDGEIGWFSPERRGLLPLEKRRWPHGIRRDLRRHAWEIRCDTAFAEVIRHCAARPETWIDERIVEAYTALHRAGFAHSLEVWLDGELVGGLYGVHLGSAFFGESMFHLVCGASKVALVALIEGLFAGGFHLLDTQWQTPHLQQFGGYEIPRTEYLQRLERALRIPCRFPEFNPWKAVGSHSDRS
jgi:leucyl/phenylalanyl-tRNA---protein transferase